MKNTGQNIMILCSAPSPDVARLIAMGLVKLNYAACCQVLPGIESFYRWKNELCNDNESLLVIKSTQSRYQDIEKYIQQHHPYELPECIALPITQGTQKYLQWINDQVT